MNKKAFLLFLLLTPLIVIVSSTLAFRFGFGPEATKNNGVFFNEFTDITGMTVNITPSSASNKVLVLVHCPITMGDAGGGFTLVRGSTEIFKGDTAGSRSSATIFTNLGNYTGGGVVIRNSHIEYLDSPNTTSATTYKIQTTRQSDSTPYVVINRSKNDTDASYGGRSASSITAMEVAA